MNTQLQRLNPEAITPPVGVYSHGVVAPGQGRWLYVAGQVGIARDGSVARDFEAQADQVWRNVQAVLEAAGMGMGDLVKITSYVVDTAHLPLFGPIRARYLGDARPASTLIVASALARPEWLVEVEAVAWRP